MASTYATKSFCPGKGFVEFHLKITSRLADPNPVVLSEAIK